MNIRNDNIRMKTRFAGQARKLFLPMAAITLVFAVSASYADCTPRLYGTSYKGSDSLADLYSIDPLTGQGTEIGPTGFQRISALDVDPVSGIIYAVAERDSDDQVVLISIDHQTGAGTEIVDLTLGIASEDEFIAGMSFNGSGVLYGYGSFDQGVYIIAVPGGAVSTLGTYALGQAGNGVAFSPEGTLYHVGDQDLHTVNLTNGLLTLVAEMTYSYVWDSPQVPAMDYGEETGIYYAIVKEKSGESHLATINVATGYVERIGSTTDSMGGLTYFCEEQGTDDEIFKNGFEGP